MYGISSNRKTGAGDILLTQVGQRFVELPAPSGVGSRDALAGGPSLPDAQKPDPVEAHLSESVQFDVRDIVQGCRAAKASGALRKPDSGVDLVEQWIARRSARLDGHGQHS